MNLWHSLFKTVTHKKKVALLASARACSLEGSLAKRPKFANLERLGD
jgi:hypothetical protein